MAFLYKPDNALIYYLLVTWARDVKSCTKLREHEAQTTPVRALQSF